MYKFKSSLIALIGLVSLMTIATVMVPHIGYGSPGGSAPTPSTQNVNVVNTPTVNAQQSGTWSVGISGTPVVGLDAANNAVKFDAVNNTVKLDAANNTVKFDAVNNTVKIDAATPVMVRDADSLVRQPFQLATSLVIPFGETQAMRSIQTVPAGKVLVIEDVSAEGRLFGNDKLLSLAITVDGAPLYLHPNDEGTDDQGRRIYIASQHVRLYVSEGVQVGCFAQRNPATGQPDLTFSVFGYFVDKP